MSERRGQGDDEDACGGPILAAFEAETRRIGWSSAAIESERRGTIAHLTRLMGSWRHHVSMRGIRQQPAASRWRIMTPAK